MAVVGNQPIKPNSVEKNQTQWSPPLSFQPQKDESVCIFYEKPAFTSAENLCIKPENQLKPKAKTRVGIVDEPLPLPFTIVNGVKGAVRAIPSIVEGSETLRNAITMVSSGVEELDTPAKIAQTLHLGGKTLAAADKVVNALEPISNFIQKTPVRAVLGGIGVATGGYEIYRSIAKEQDTGNKVYGVAHGAVTVVAGGALVVGAAPVAAVAGAVVVGMEIEKFGNGEVQRLGMLKDKQGKNQTAFGRLEERAKDIGAGVKAATGCAILGDITGVASGVLMAPTAGVVALAGAVAGGADRAWSFITGKK